MASTFTITTLPKALPMPHFVIIGGNGGQKGFAADEKTKEVFTRVIEDIQAIADRKNLGHVHTYDVSVRTAVVEIVTVDGRTHTISLYEIDDHTNLDTLRSQLAEKGHTFDCAHSFDNSCDMRIQDIKKRAPHKWKFWNKSPADDQLEISELNDSKKRFAEAKKNSTPPPENFHEESDDTATLEEMRAQLELL